MSMANTMYMVNRRMKRLVLAKKKIPLLEAPLLEAPLMQAPLLEAPLLEALDDPTGNFENIIMSPANAIVCGNGNEAKKGRSGNAAYRHKIAGAKQEYLAATTAGEKNEIAQRISNELLDEGYVFFSKVEGIWTVMEKQKVIKKVKQSFRDCMR